MVGASLTLGRDLSNDVVLVDAQVSGHHAVVEAGLSGLVVRDFGAEGAETYEDSKVERPAAQWLAAKIAAPHMQDERVAT